ncbi:hypothetical protein LJK88_17795 [Paenibacillus sp. P26]|nr:hypothetical protein LJK88_17795 [Paenibacillus sp. P26]
MADLRINLAGIESPNPFWLASAPPTNTGYQVQRAFEAGWGGAVWKTLGEPIINTSSRFAAVHFGGAGRRLQQHRAHYGPSAGSEPEGNLRNEEKIP